MTATQRAFSIVLLLSCLESFASAVDAHCESNDEHCLPDDGAALLQLQPASVSPEAAKSMPVHGKIPKQLVMTGKFDSAVEFPAFVKKQLDKTLQTSGLTLRYLSDVQCRFYINKHYDMQLVSFYDNEIHGAFRGDMCRTAILLREGGFYMDMDFQLHVPIHTLVSENTTFMSVLSYTQVGQYDDDDSADPVVLNALIAVQPNNIVMKTTLLNMMKWYADFHEGLLGPRMMHDALKELMLKSCSEAIGRPPVPPKWPTSSEPFQCGSETLQFYKEESLFDCAYHGPVVCPPDRDLSKYSGTKFGVFKMQKDRTGPDVDRLIGWPRFTECDKEGCGLNGGAATL